MTDHRCTFDSEQGWLPQRLGLSLRCQCGRWRTIGAGTLGAKPQSDNWPVVLAAILFLIAVWVFVL